jgi:hypothetical protein
VNGTTSTIFVQKSMVKLVFKNKQLFVFWVKRKWHKNIDEIDASPGKIDHCNFI